MADMLVAQLAREPVPAQVKTRLQPPLSAGQACDLHRRMVELTAATLRQLADMDTQVWIEGNPHSEALAGLRRLGLEPLQEQRGGDLGERMATIVREGLSRYRAVILVGSDCPGLDEAYLLAAGAALTSTEVVLGPAHDGGYVLLGMRQYLPWLFTDMPWGTGRVLPETLLRLQQRGVAYKMLPLRRDIDRPEDLLHLPPAWRQDYPVPNPESV